MRFPNTGICIPLVVNSANSFPVVGLICEALVVDLGDCSILWSSQIWMVVPA
jgi:hypothetical protein